MLPKNNKYTDYYSNKEKLDIYDFNLNYSDDDDFNSDTALNQQPSNVTYTYCTEKSYSSDDDDFNSDEISIIPNINTPIPINRKDINSQEVQIKISKKESSNHSPKSISDNDLAELLVKENNLILLDNVLHYWSKTKKHYIPLVGENADKFIRLRTPSIYKGKINQRSINEIIQWLKINENLEVNSFNDSQQYIAFQNGIYNLRDAQLLDHDSNYYLTNIIQANYPNDYFYNNSGEHFEQFLFDVTQGEDALYDRLQELFGYVLSNIRNVKCIPFLVGVKDTGKSIVLKLLETLIGEDSFTNLSFEQLNTPVFLAELIGKKLNTCGELGEFKLNRLDVFKKLSGGDSLLAKPLYEKPIKFKNTAALIFAGNHLPVIKGLDKANAFSNRLVIFPFMYPISKENQDIYLFEKLIEESSYIVSWAIEGLQRWIDNNYEFTSCELIDELSQNYAQQNNSIENFINDKCVYDASSKTFKDVLETHYYEYCNEFGLNPSTSKEFHNQLKLNIRLTHKRFRQNDENKYGYIGIGLKTNWRL